MSRADEVQTFIEALRELAPGRSDDELCLALDMVVHDVKGEERADIFNSGGAGERLEEAGITPPHGAMAALEMLDGVLSQEASAINNDGLMAQAAFLLLTLGPDPVRAAQAAFDSPEFDS